MIILLSWRHLPFGSDSRGSPVGYDCPAVVTSIAVWKRFPRVTSRIYCPAVVTSLAVWKRFLRCTSRIWLSCCRDVTCRLEAIPEVHQSDRIVLLSWRHLPFRSDSWGSPVGYDYPAAVTSLAVWKRFLRCTSRIYCPAVVTSIAVWKRFPRVTSRIYCPAVVTSLAVWKRFLRCTSRIWLSCCRDVTCRLEAIPEVHQSDRIVLLSWRHLPFGSDSWGSPVGYDYPAAVTSLAVWKRFLRCTSRIWWSCCRDVTCRLEAIPEVHQSDMIVLLPWRHLPFGSDSWGSPVRYDGPAVVTSLAVWKRFLRCTSRIYCPAVVTSLAVWKRFMRCTSRIWWSCCRDVTCRLEAIPEGHQ